MPLQDSDDLHQFQLVVEQLEVCRELILGGTAAKVRMALILLDNAAEIMLYRLSRETLSCGRYVRWVMPERLSPADRRTIDRVFHAKLDLAQREHSIEQSVIIILRILHSHRNAAFHRDTHNPAVIPILARIGFKAVSDLFVRTRSGIRASAAGGYKSPIDWLSRYGLANTFIDYEKAAIVIAEQLAMDTEPNLDMVREQLVTDLQTRIAAIRRLIVNEFPWKTAAELNRILKWFEFKDADPDLEDRLSKPYRSAVYSITSNQAVDVTPAELNSLEKQFRDEYEARLEAYEQRIHYEDLEGLEAQASELGQKCVLSALLATYSDLDGLLSILERYFDLAFQEWDREVQREIDLRRGK